MTLALAEAALEGDFVNSRSMADDRDLNNFSLFVNAIHNSVIAASDAAESMQRPRELLAILLRSRPQAIDRGGEASGEPTNRVCASLWRLPPEIQSYRTSGLKLLPRNSLVRGLLQTIQGNFCK